MRNLVFNAAVCAVFLALGIASVNSYAQVTGGTAAPTTGSGASSSSATGVNSATTQSPTTTFQLQDNSRHSSLNIGTQIQPLSQPSGLLQNHAPVITPSGSINFGQAASSLGTQSLTPNQFATPNPVMPNQVGRSVLSSPTPVMPTYQRSSALQQLQPQLIQPSMMQH